MQSHMWTYVKENKNEIFNHLISIQNKKLYIYKNMNGREKISREKKEHFLNEKKFQKQIE